MKTLSLLLLPIVLLITPTTVLSQDASEQAIQELQQEIAKREALDLDASIPADLKAHNRSVLEKRRSELITTIQARIAALEKYLRTLGDLATQEERQYARDSLRRLSAATSSVANNATSVAPAENPTPVTEASPARSTATSPLRSEASRAVAPASNEAAANAGALPVQNQITGTVTLKNEHFHVGAKLSNALRTGFASKNNVTLAGAKVVAELVGSTTKYETITNTSGAFTLDLPNGNYIVSASVGDYKTEEPLQVNGAGAVVNLQLLVRPLGEYSRAIVGFEQAGASAAQADQNYFFDLTLSAPLPFGTADPYFGRRGRMWGTARITSVPQQINSGVATFATGFAQQVGNLQVNEVAQGFEFLAGTEIRLTKRMSPFGSFDGTTTNRFSVALIAAAGAITPMDPKTTLEVFKIFPDAPGLPTIPPGKEFIAFFSPDRDRFFRQYYAGLRLQTYYFNYRNPDVPLQRYPAVLDITYGQNEAVTGGHLHGGVLRLEGFYPLPYDGLKFINLFGTALLRPKRSRVTDPLILEPAPADTVVPGANVFLQTVPQFNRDYYRIGVGIDFMSLINKLRTP